MGGTIPETKLNRDDKHSHFWIWHEQLYESYFTLRGIRYRLRMEVPGMPDEDVCSPECITYIEKEYL